MNEESTEVESVPDGELTSVEVGFDICGIDPEPEIPVDQDKPRMHLNLPCVLKSFILLYQCFVAFGNRS
jgi:hypothetical protein